MDNFTYFHLCDHRIKRKMKDGEITTLTVTAGKDLIHTVVNGGVILEILEVRALEYDKTDIVINEFYYDNPFRLQTYDDVDPGDSYYDDQEEFIVDYSQFFSNNETISEPLPSSFYEPILHNRIRWMVKPPTKYQVKANVRFLAKTHDIYSPTDCPVCGGKGWFIDILNKDGQFERPRGIVKIAQRVVKDMLTELGSSILDTEYGYTFKKEALQYSSDDETLRNFVMMLVSEVENNYLTDQQEMITQLNDEEILSQLTCENVYRLPQDKRFVVIQLRITTPVEERTFQVGLN